MDRSTLAETADASTKYDLQPGEVYVLTDLDDRNYSENYSSRASLEEALQDLAEECLDDRRDFDDRVKVFIKRCNVPIRAANKVTVSLG